MSWTKIYANNAQGGGTYGTLAALVDAIRQGQEVRMLVRVPASPDQEFFTSAENIWIRNGVVTAQNTSGVSVSFVGTGFQFEANAYHYMILVSTNGVMDQTRWLIGEHTAIGQNQDAVEVTWFVG